MTCFQLLVSSELVNHAMLNRNKKFEIIFQFEAIDRKTESLNVSQRQVENTEKDSFQKQKY